MKHRTLIIALSLSIALASIQPAQAEMLKPPKPKRCPSGYIGYRQPGNLGMTICVPTEWGNPGSRRK